MIVCLRLEFSKGFEFPFAVTFQDSREMPKRFGIIWRIFLFSTLSGTIWLFLLLLQEKHFVKAYKKHMRNSFRRLKIPKFSLAFSYLEKVIAGNIKKKYLCSKLLKNFFIFSQLHLNLIKLSNRKKEMRKKIV